MIKKSAVDDFLSRKRADSDKAKRFSRRTLVWRARRICRSFHTEPYKHQLVAFLLAEKHAGYFLMLDMGAGKTKVSLDLIRHRRARHLVLVPGTANVGEWLEQAALHQPGLNAVGLEEGMTAEKRHNAVLWPSDLLVTTYAGWLRLCCQKRGKRLQVDDKRARLMEEQFDGVIFDESTALKNPQSLTFKCAKRLASRCRYRLALSGTPFDKDPGDLWAQFYAVDLGDTLGQSLGLYRQAFFELRENHWNRWGEWHFVKRHRKTLNRMLRHRSVHYSMRECTELPPTTGGIEQGFKVHRVGMPQSTMRYYASVQEELAKAKGDYTLTENTYMRMRQLTAGYMTLKDDEEKMRIAFKRNPKADAVVQLLSEVPGDQQAIVFVHFNLSGDLVSERLKDAGIKHALVYGKTRKKRKVVESFKRGEVPVLVGSSAVAYGLNLHCASYLFFFESPDSCIVRRQVEKRMVRPGQKRKTFIHDIAVRGSIDEKILDLQAQGIDLHQAIVEGKM
jgi:SNF2 family DNA or RNA helicase